MTPVRFLAAARSEFLAAIDYYNRHDAGLGERFTDSVEDAIARAQAFPLSGVAVTPRTRRVILRGFPFCVVYEAAGDGILVVAIAHQARMPGYWQSRVQEDGHGVEYATAEAA